MQRPGLVWETEAAPGLSILSLLPQLPTEHLSWVCFFLSLFLTMSLSPFQSVLCSCTSLLYAHTCLSRSLFPPLSFSVSPSLSVSLSVPTPQRPSPHVCSSLPDLSRDLSGKGHIRDHGRAGFAGNSIFQLHLVPVKSKNVPKSIPSALYPQSRLSHHRQG